MIKEKTLDVLRQLGFQPEPLDDDFGYRFEYEGLQMLYSPDDDEAECVHLIVPSLFDVTDENRESVKDAMLRLAARIKFVQPIVMFKEQVWLNYQHFLGDNEVTPKLLEHMIRVLSFASIKFHDIITGDENDD